MLADFQKKNFEKSYYVQYSLNQKKFDILKILINKLLVLDKCFYYQNCFYNQIQKHAILNISK